MATKATETTEAAPEQQSDGPLLDLTDAAVKKMIKTARKRGYVTYDELNDVLPSEEFSSEQIEDVLGQLSELGINVVEAEEVEEAQAEGEAGEEEAEGTDLVAASTSRAVAAKPETTKEPTDRTDDPVRMYLREMGSVELLSREGEIAIAKRIEAGHEAMIAGLCESPLTFQAIIIWRDELNEARVLLRDIIDLEATYEGPEAKQNQTIADHSGTAQNGARPNGAPTNGAAATGTAQQQTAASGEAGEGENQSDDDDEDDDDYENALSLAAMEAELKPKVLETFDDIAANYKKLRKQQDKKIELQVAGDMSSPQAQRAYDKLREEIISDVKSLSLNNNRIDSLVEQR